MANDDSKPPVDWTQHMHDSLFATMNELLGSPRDIDEEFVRYQMSHTVAPGFWKLERMQPWHGLSPVERDISYPKWRDATDENLNGAIEHLLTRIGAERRSEDGQA